MAGFDRFMVQVDIGTNRKLRRLPVVQRWAYVAGVLPLAAQSPMRGALLIADGEPVTADDVAKEATIQLKDARAAMATLRRLGMLEADSEGVEWVHDWDKYNPDPRPSDSPEARRERKRRSRAKQRGHADVTRDTPEVSRVRHDPEGEGEGEETEQEGMRAGARTGALHPQLPEVVAILEAAPGLIVEAMAVDSACRAHQGADVVAAANIVASWAHEGGLQVRHASRLLHRALDRQTTDTARRERALAQPVRAAPPRAGRPSAEERAAALEAEAAAERRNAA